VSALAAFRPALTDDLAEPTGLHEEPQEFGCLVRVEVLTEGIAPNVLARDFGLPVRLYPAQNPTSILMTITKSNLTQGQK
jgi:hypothetical protein